MADLCAQWRAAIAAEEAAAWTRNGFWLSLGGALLSALGLACLLLSLRQTERSLEQSTQANRDAAQAFKIELAAYVGTTGAKGFYLLGQGARIAFNIENFGQTPAYDTVLSTTVNVRPSVTGEVVKDTEVFVEILGIIEPSQRKTVIIYLPEGFFDEVREQIAKQELRAFFNTSVNFTDIYKVSRRRSFVYYLRTLRTFGDNPGVPLEISAWQNDAT